MTRPSADTPPLLSDWTLERFVLGELSPERHQEVVSAIASYPEVAARISALHADNRATLERYPKAAVTHRIRNAAPQKSQRRALVPVLAFAVALLTVVPLVFSNTNRPVEPDVLTKGSVGPDQAPNAALHVFLDDGGELTPGATVRAGDILGFRVDRGNHPFGALLSLDGAGVVTLHLPPTAEADLHLAPGLVTLDLGYQLDDAPDFERFFFLVADRPFDLPAVLEAAQRLAAGDGRTGKLEVSGVDLVVEFGLNKEKPR